MYGSCHPTFSFFRPDPIFFHLSYVTKLNKKALPSTCISSHYITSHSASVRKSLPTVPILESMSQEPDIFLFGLIGKFTITRKFVDTQINICLIHLSFN